MLLLFSVSALAIDTDGDGVDDSVDHYPTNPAEWSDADQDGLPDNWEVAHGRDPLRPDYQIVANSYYFSSGGALIYDQCSITEGTVNCHWAIGGGIPGSNPFAVGVSPANAYGVTLSSGYVTLYRGNAADSYTNSWTNYPAPSVVSDIASVFSTRALPTTFTTSTTDIVSCAHQNPNYITTKSATDTFSCSVSGEKQMTCTLTKYSTPSQMCTAPPVVTTTIYTTKGTIAHLAGIKTSVMAACALTEYGPECFGGSIPFAGNFDPDGDGITGLNDAFPLDASESVDTDHDGIGNNADSDDDNDGMPDTWELQYGLNPLVNDANGDLDGDGISNLQEYTNGSNPTVFNKALVKNDYVNNKIAGWIWQGVSNGFETESQDWQLTFPLYSTNWAIPNRFYMPIFPDQANWDIVTTGDFNKDGDADILWRNKTTDDWKIWQMQNGTRVAQTSWTDSFDPTHAWQVIGAGDTDKDGDDDVILNNASTGEIMIWEMQNRIGDFNKDGDVDLLLRQNGGDALITWEIENNAFVAERALANTGTGFNPVCAGDFDNDGDDDILLINSSTMVEKWFVMENYTRSSQQFGASNVGFVFKGCGDYDGDGDADMFWQRSADDMNRIVLQQNWGATKQTVYTNPFGGVNPANAGYGYLYRGNGN